MINRWQWCEGFIWYGVIIPLLFFTCIFEASAETVEISRSPRMQNFNKLAYGAANQNWDVATSEAGYIYFANSVGLLQYDSKRWELFPTKEMLRAVKPVNNLIYVGGKDILGYYEETHQGLIYHDLTELIDFQDEIWKIIPVAEKIVFQSFKALYIYDGKRIRQQNLTGNLTTYAYGVRDHLYYHESHGALVKVNLEGGRQVFEEQMLKQWKVKFIYELEQDQLLLGTLRHGLFLYDQEGISPLENELSELLKKYQINKAIPLPQLGWFAFATMNQGVLIAHLDGRIRHHLDTQNGLSDNRIHGLAYKNGALWVGTENGISQVVLDDPLYFFHDPLVQLGAIEDAIAFDGHYYIGTNQGVYVSDGALEDPDHRLELIPGTDGQVWKFSIVHGTLFCGHNDGVFQLQGKVARKISSRGGAYQLIAPQDKEDLMITTGYRGLEVYQKSEGDWKHLRFIPGFDQVLHYLLPLEDGSYLASGPNKNLWQFRLDEKCVKILELEDLRVDAQLKNSGNLKLDFWAGEALIIGKDSVFRFNQDGISAGPEELQGVQEISARNGDFHLLNQRGQLVLWDLKKGQRVSLPKHVERQADLQIFGKEKLIPFGTALFFIPIEKGFEILNVAQLNDRTTPAYAPVMRGISWKNERTDEFFENIEQDEIPYAYNSVNLRFTDFNYLEEVPYEYQLSGYHQEWMLLGGQENLTFGNLPAGQYQFLLRNPSGDVFPLTDFEISPPWYKNSWSILLYVMVLISLIGLAWKWHQLRMRKLTLEMLQRKRMLLKQQRQENEWRLKEMERLQLEEEVSESNRELSRIMARHGKNRELIGKLREEVNKLKDKGNIGQTKALTKLHDIIDNNLDEVKDWQVFESAFNQKHANFFTHLKKAHPQLTAEDLKLCAYLKMHLSTKELAPIFNITPKSVEVKRYRLRKKMDLPKEKSLQEYLDNF